MFYHINTLFSPNMEGHFFIHYHIKVMLIWHFIVIGFIICGGEQVCQIVLVYYFLRDKNTIL